MSAELAARRTAAAVLADYTHAAATADVAGRALWAARLAGMLAYVLSAPDALETQRMPASGKTPGQVAYETREIGLHGVITFSWHRLDLRHREAEEAGRQYVLEQIDDIVNRSRP
jgi:hypothetical protein